MSIKFPPHVTYREAFGTDHQKTYRGRGSEVQKKYSRKGKLKEKKFMHAARKFPTPTPPHNFSNGLSLRTRLFRDTF